ncbi:MAG: site-specific integrase [Proteobacteria bacterium]|nr:site-specific integrase [Pseudomonadota bacterium]
MGVTVREKVKGSGIWWIFINHKGYRTSKFVGKDKRSALAVAETVNASLVLGDLGILKDNKPSVKTFREYADLWISITVPATCKPSTERDYQGLLKNHILPCFGKMPVDKITRLTVKNFLMKKVKGGFAQSTITHMKNAVSGVLSLALDDEIIPANPAYSVGKIFKKQDAGPKIDPYSIDELASLLKVIQTDFSDHYPFFRTLSGTGMRFGEGLGLQWNDIDFESRFIMIQRGVSKGYEDSPKNGMGRKIDMDKELAKILKGLKHQRKLQALKNGWKEVPEWIFVKDNGIPYHESYLRRLFYRAIKKGNLRPIHVHDLRHTYATLRIANGDNIADVSKQLGHHSIAFTTSFYYHWKPGCNKSEVDAFGSLVSKKIINQK